MFEETNFSKNYVNLVDTSAKTNLLFVGNPLKPELKGTSNVVKQKHFISLLFLIESFIVVFKLHEIVNRKYDDLPNINNRIVPLAGCPQLLACNNDGSMLAIHYMLNNSGFLQIMQTESFLTSVNVPSVIIIIM